MPVSLLQDSQPTNMPAPYTPVLPMTFFFHVLAQVISPLDPCLFDGEQVIGFNGVMMPEISAARINKEGV